MSFNVIVGIAAIVSAVMAVLSYRVMHIQHTRKKKKADHLTNEQNGSFHIDTLVRENDSEDCKGHEDTASFEPIDYGNWVNNGNGTATDRLNHLMWIQGPWGVKFDGSDFVGEAVKLGWREAASRFGQGNTIENEKGYGRISEMAFQESTYQKGYTRGSDVVNFAGFSDWRLPTAIELKQLRDSGVMGRKLFKRVQGSFWSANPRVETGFMKFLVEKGIWPGYNVAWYLSLNDQSLWPDLDCSVESKYGVILVRDYK